MFVFVYKHPKNSIILHIFYNTLFVGKVFIQLDKIGSTNDYLLDLLKKQPVLEGTTVSAHHQYRGKGQQGATWDSVAEKNITMSLVLYPKFLNIRNQFYLSQCVALAVYHLAKDVLQNHQPSFLRIKWPNDIYYGNRKLGGILIENLLDRQKINTSVIGIGLNVNQFIFPKHLYKAISFQQITGQEYDIVKLIQKLCSYLEVQYLQLKADKLTAIQSSYLKNLYRFGEYHYYETPSGERLYAQISGIGTSGKLRLRYQLGLADVEQTFGVKEIQFCD